MKITVKEEFNIFELFVHDNEAIHAICPYELAEAINEHLDDWRVCPPESLSRFTVFATYDEEESYMERYYTVQQVKAELPSDLIDRLEEINKLDLDLSPKENRD